jgi:ferric iron reductase protein FhuF
MALLGPVHEALACLPASDDGELSAAVLARIPDEGRWLSLSALASEDDLLDAAIDRVARNWNTDRRDIAGGALVADVGFALLLRSAAAVLAARRAPALTGDDVAVRIHDAGWVDLVVLGSRFACLPADPAAAAPGAEVVEDEEALLRWVLADFEAFLDPLVERVHARCRRPRRALWRHGGDVVAEAFLWAGELLGDRTAAWALGPRAVALLPSRLKTHADYRVWRAGDVEQPGRVRAQCCLHYRTPAARYCFSCPLKGDDHRVARIAGRVQEEAAA